MASNAVVTTPPRPLRSSRRRPLLQDQGFGPAYASTHIPSPAPTLPPAPRERTTSIETIRATVPVRPRLSVATLLKPKPALPHLPGSQSVDAPVGTGSNTPATLSVMKRSLTSIASSTSTSKKRRHSEAAASSEPEADVSLSPLGGTPAEPSKHARNRQRTDSFAIRARKDSERFASRTQVAMKTKDEEEAVETNTIRMKSSAGAASALKKLKEKLNSTHGQLDLVAMHRRRSRSPSPVDAAELFAFPSGDTPDHLATPPPPATTTKPLQTLSLNTEPITVSSSSFARRPLRVVQGARINKFGCYEPDISEFELSIASVTGSATPEFEVWDQEDELFFVGPLALHLTLKDPVKWAGLPLSHPDVVVDEMTCTSKPILSATHPYRSASNTTSDSSIFASRYEAPEPKSKPKSPSSTTPIVPPDPKRGIVIEPLWMRTYPDTDPYTGKLVGRRGWATHFSVPVATRLFERCETREFGFDVKILVWGDMLRVDGGATMCVSHLHRDRDMAGHTSNGAI